MLNTTLYAQRHAVPAGSPIRELFPYAGIPGMTSFAGGYPSLSLLDHEGLLIASQQAVADQSCLQYGATEGTTALRQRLQARNAVRGVLADVSQLLVTTGSQQAFDLLARVLLEPGDTVMVESPTYPATLQTLRLADANVIAVPCDAQGLDTEQLENRLQQLPPGTRLKLLYTVPNFSNPGGTVLSDARRRRLVELACQYGFLIAEDDPYGDLNFTGKSLTSIYQHATQSGCVNGNPVVYLSSLSKTVAPGLRIGWMTGSVDLVRRCAIAKQTADLCTSPIAQAIATAYLDLQRFDETVKKATDVYRGRLALLVSELGRVLGNRVDFTVPEGGMFLWLRLLEDIDCDELLKAAIAAKVLYVPGNAFFLKKAHVSAMRLSFAGLVEEDIPTGVARLATAMDAVARAARRFHTPNPNVSGSGPVRPSARSNAAMRAISSSSSTKS